MAFKTLIRASEVDFRPGDRLVLANGETYKNQLVLKNKNGTKFNPIIITSLDWYSNAMIDPAIINFKGESNGVLIQNSSFLEINNILLTADGYFEVTKQNSKMRCAILIRNTDSISMTGLLLNNITINHVYFENKGFSRGYKEVKTSNGTQNYGWGIRVINKTKATIKDVEIRNSCIRNVSHTGIKLTGLNKNIINVKILNNTVKSVGGPGIQMSGVKDVYVANNLVSHSGSKDDSRKWGRGSGLWTWSSSKVLIEKNKFLYANGPGDSAGAHIDFNCDTIILQYNISAYNTGGFCEILGNNYNCVYRYNISINDGSRVKGKNGAFQEGKILWLSGYQGKYRKRKGPVNSYIYNNTIYSDSTITSKIAIDNTSNGILIANNIFYLKNEAKAVLGDQYKPAKISESLARNVFFKNNLFLTKNSWPKNIGITDANPIIGDPNFIYKKGFNAKDFIPQNKFLVKHKGIIIKPIPISIENDLKGIKFNHIKDILGNRIKGLPSLGAVEPL